VFLKCIIKKLKKKNYFFLLFIIKIQIYTICKNCFSSEKSKSSSIIHQSYIYSIQLVIFIQLYNLKKLVKKYSIENEYILLLGYVRTYVSTYYCWDMYVRTQVHITVGICTYVRKHISLLGYVRTYVSTYYYWDMFVRT
jgi:hypothetical protein